MKSVNALYFGQNNKKVGKFSFYIEKPVPFPRIKVLLMQKNVNVLFSVGGNIFKRIVVQHKKRFATNKLLPHL